MQKDFRSLKKLNKEIKDDEFSQSAMLIGDTATQLLSTAISGAVKDKNLGVRIIDTDYDQIRQLVYDIDSELYTTKPDFVIIYLSSEKLYLSYQNTPLKERKDFAENTYKTLSSYYQKIHSQIKTKIIQYNYIELNDMTAGSYSLSLEHSFIYQVRKLNLLMMEHSQKDGVYLVDLDHIVARKGYQNIHQDAIYDVATMSVINDFLPDMAYAVSDVIAAIKGKIHKCVVLDLDNTLWGGVIGDDGINNIEIGDLGTGKAFSRFQRWLKELTYRGIILAVCSKNDAENAKEPFLKHPDMVLKLEDIAIFVANWNDKASNIRYIQKTLNISMESMVFIDDNSFERGIVKESIPEIEVPDMPEDPSEYVSYLESLNLFETASYSEEDISRGKQYREEAMRQEEENSFASIDEFLSSLNMISHFGPFEEFSYPRIAQLTQRSNQFNLRTIRYTLDQIREIAQDEHYLTLQFSLKDRFGDSGLISLMILKKEDEKTLFIDTWLMSCRVLKRTMEAFIINKLIQTAEEHGYSIIKAEYLKTAKNKMVENIYKEMGFTDLGEGKYVLHVSQYQENKTFVKGENE